MTATPDAPMDQYLLTRLEYDRAVDAGAFRPGARLELIEGKLHAMTPQGTAHTTGMHLVADYLREAFGPGHVVRIQNPLAVAEYSEPEPDVAVVAGAVRNLDRDGRTRIPGTRRPHVSYAFAYESPFAAQSAGTGNGRQPRAGSPDHDAGRSPAAGPGSRTSGRAGKDLLPPGPAVPPCTAGFSTRHGPQVQEGGRA